MRQKARGLRLPLHLGMLNIPSFLDKLACVGLSHSMTLAHGERSHLGDFVFSICNLLKNRLYLSSFAPEKNLEKKRHQAKWDKPIKAKTSLTEKVAEQPPEEVTVK